MGGEPKPNPQDGALDGDFLSLVDAHEEMGASLRAYDEGRSHSDIGYNVPISLTDYGGASGPLS